MMGFGCPLCYYFRREERMRAEEETLERRIREIEAIALDLERLRKRPYLDDELFEAKNRLLSASSSLREFYQS